MAAWMAYTMIVTVLAGIAAAGMERDGYVGASEDLP